MLLLVLLLMLDFVLVFVLALVLVLMFKILFMIMFMILFMMMLTRAIAHWNLMCTKIGKCCLMIMRSHSVKHLGFCVVVEYVCVVCGGMCVCVSVQAFVSVQCVRVVCLCKGVVVVCVLCDEWVSVCACSCFVWLCCHLFMCREW